MKKLIIIASTFLIVLVAIFFLIYNILYPLKYKEEILIAAQTYGIDPELIASIINAESSFKNNQISAKNAVGLMQLLPSTASSLTDEEFDLFDAKTNILLGTKYLAYLINKFKDIDTALFAYNAGEGNVLRWLKEQNCEKLKTCPYEETNAYVKKVKNSLRFYRNRI